MDSRAPRQHPTASPQGLARVRAIVAPPQRTHGNVKEAAASLGVDRSTLYDKLKRYEIAR